MKTLSTLLILFFATLWCNAQPTLLKDVNTGASNTYLTENNMYNIGADAIFVNTDDSTVWITNGSTAGTKVLFNYQPSAMQSFTNPYGFCKVNNMLFYFTEVNNDTTHLWYYNLTANSNHLVKTFKKIGQGFNNANSWLYPVIEYKGKLVFSALAYEDAHIVTGKGVELWESDGTPTGTKMLSDVNFGVGSSMCTGFVKAYGSLFFIATTQIGSPTPTTRLWVTDGTSTGTVAHPGNIYFSATTYHLGYRFLNNKLHVVAPDLVTVGSNLSTVWRVESATSTTNASFSAYRLAGYGYFNDNYYFTGIPYNSGPADPKNVELYKISYNITGATQAELVKDILPQPHAGGGSFVIDAFNNNLYFVANDESYNAQLWQTNGTEAGTTKLTNFRARNNLNQLNLFTVISNKIYFFADDSTNGFELQMIDPTTNTITPYNIRSGEEPGNAPQYLLPVGNFAIYLYDDGTHGVEPWVIGTPNLPSAVAQINGKTKHTYAYPNPANKFIQFNNEDKSVIKLFNMQGQLVLMQDLNNNQAIDISALSNGIVFYNISNKNGEITNAGKFVKQ